MGGVTSISVIMPAYNEAANLAVVVPRTLDVLDEIPGHHEVIVVDDGSNDGTAELMSELRKSRPSVRYLRLRRNYGKSTALQAGFERAHGRTIVLMDADGQDQPESIPELLAALDGGLDLATGRRVQRNDRFIKRTTSQALQPRHRGGHRRRGRGLQQRPEGDAARGHDTRSSSTASCTATSRCSRTGRASASARCRSSTSRACTATSKFGRARFWRGFLDLLTVKFITTYTGRPFHLFGGVGILFGAIGSALVTWMLIVKISGGAVGTRPALQAGILLVVVGVQLMSLGLIAELIVHFRRDRAPDVLADSDR